MQAKLDAVRNDPMARWLQESERELGVPIPTIEAALDAHHVFASERQRSLFSTPFRRPAGRFGNDRESVLDELHGALYAAMIMTYAEGLALLAAGSEQHGFHFDCAEVIRILEGACNCSGESS